MSPRLIGGLVVVLALCAIGGGIYLAGVRAGGDAMARRVQAQIDRAAEAQRRIDRATAAVDATAAAREGERRDEVREVYREAIRIVDRPVYRGQWADADGVGLLERAVAAANGDGRSAARERADGGTAAVRAAPGQR